MCKIGSNKKQLTVTLSSFSNDNPNHYQIQIQWDQKTNNHKVIYCKL